MKEDSVVECSVGHLYVPDFDMEDCPYCTMDQVKAALTPKEWERVKEKIKKAEEDADLTRYYDRARRIEDYAVYWLEGGADYRRGEGGAAHGAAAMLLYNQPFGFTWEDVDRLHKVDRVDAEGDLLCSIADRIAALLPPRET